MTFRSSSLTRTSQVFVGQSSVPYMIRTPRGRSSACFQTCTRPSLSVSRHPHPIPICLFKLGEIQRFSTFNSSRQVPHDPPSKDSVIGPRISGNQESSEIFDATAATANEEKAREGSNRSAHDGGGSPSRYGSFSHSGIPEEIGESAEVSGDHATVSDAFEDAFSRDAHYEPSNSPTSTGAPPEHGLDNDKQLTASEDPWYLEVEAPRHTTHVFQPPPLPDIPENSPKIVSRLVKYAAEELGLSDLQILDLREIDPPSALGPNLIMMIGTARSERHLHVSAGRTVRWLKSCGVVAKADGKIGPGELRIKLKRKRKRHTLLAARGLNPAEEDDGIRMGWVYIQLGCLDGKRGKLVEYRDSEGNLSGFGPEDDSLHTTVVLQLMTEVRRQDMKLEELWQRRLEASRKQAQTLELISPVSRVALPAKHPYQSSTTVAGQTRSYFTLSRTESSLDMPLTGDQPIAGSNNLSRKPSSLDKDTAGPSLYDHIANQHKDQSAALESLRRFITSAPADEQKALLVSSEAYRDTINNVLDQISPQNSFAHRVWLYFHAGKHPSSLRDLPFNYIKRLVDEFCLGGLELPARSSVAQFLGAILAPAKGVAIVENARLALRALTSLEERRSHEPLIARDITTAMIIALSHHTASDSIRERNRMQSMLLELMFHAGVRLRKQELISLLDIFCNENQWPQFWRAWDLGCNKHGPRQLSFFTILLSYFYLRTSSASMCLHAIQRLIPELLAGRGDYIRLNQERELCTAIINCVLVAVPSASWVLKKAKQEVSGKNLSNFLLEKKHGNLLILMEQVRAQELQSGVLQEVFKWDDQIAESNQQWWEHLSHQRTFSIRRISS